MKEGKHPEYRPVLFEDQTTGDKFVINSTRKTNLKGVHEGQEYPLVKLAVSSHSHSFYLGDKHKGSSYGRAAQFLKKYGKKEA